jgi:hypothetical protein
MSKFIVFQKSEAFGEYIHETVNSDDLGWGTNHYTKAYADMGMGYDDCIPAQHAAVKLLFQTGKIVAMALVEAPAIHLVFPICQNQTADGWLQDERVVALTAQTDTYSMSVGDVVLSVAEGKFFVLASYGMNEIDLPGEPS